jgi:hypothetical protein
LIWFFFVKYSLNILPDNIIYLPGNIACAVQMVKANEYGYCARHQSNSSCLATPNGTIGVKELNRLIKTNAPGNLYRVR